MGVIKNTGGIEKIPNCLIFEFLQIARNKKIIVDTYPAKKTKLLKLGLFLP